MDSSQSILRGFTCNNHEVEVDEDGFLRQPELWNDQLALALARADGITELTEAHWKIIHYIRSYFQEFDTAPTHTQALPGDRLLLAGNLRTVSLRTGEGRMQSGGAAPAGGLRIAASFTRTKVCALCGVSNGKSTDLFR